MLNGSALVHPEMGEKLATDKLFHVQHNFRDSYSLTWLVSRDAEAREVLKRLRVRAKKHSPFVQHETGPGKSSYGMWSGQTVYSGLISGDAEDKLVAAGLVCIEKLLD